MHEIQKYFRTILHEIQEFLWVKMHEIRKYYNKSHGFVQISIKSYGFIMIETMCKRNVFLSFMHFFLYLVQEILYIRKRTFIMSTERGGIL